MFEVPINYNGRGYDEGKKITWRDGVAALWFIFSYRFTSQYSDPGKVTLDAIEHAPKFNRWMYDSVKPWLGKRVAELGVRPRQHEQFLPAPRPRPAHRLPRSITSNRFASAGDTKRNLAFAQTRYDAARRLPSSCTEFAPDSVVFLNVLEHIEDDRAVLQNLFEHVPTGCRIVVLVPFGMKLYSDFDKELGHFRRYESGELEAKLRDAGFDVEHQFYFNKAGELAWYVANTLGKRRKLTPSQLRIYNFLTPAFRVADKLRQAPASAPSWLPGSHRVAAIPELPCRHCLRFSQLLPDCPLPRLESIRFCANCLSRSIPLKRATTAFHPLARKHCLVYSFSRHFTRRNAHCPFRST